MTHKLLGYLNQPNGTIYLLDFSRLTNFRLKTFAAQLTHASNNSLLNLPSLLQTHIQMKIIGDQTLLKYFSRTLEEIKTI
jgi:hypothetical protein